MEEVFYTYARFERGTGSKLNLDKCEGLWLCRELELVIIEQKGTGTRPRKNVIPYGEKRYRCVLNS